MTMKMKGLLKGLRYISQIFEKEEDEEEEEEMQIGFPTDVKHVAHIGWDGPAVSSPSWMNEFRENPEGSSTSIGSNLTKDKSSKTLTSQDSTLKNAPKPSRRRTSKGDASTSFDSINKESKESIRKNPSRRQRSGDSSESTRPSRRNSSMEEGTDSTVYGQDSLSIPKQSKKKNKSKGSSRSGDGGSTRSRSKGSDLPNINEDGPVSPFMALKLED